MKYFLFPLMILLLGSFGCEKHETRLRIGIIKPSLNHLPLDIAFQYEYLSPADYEIHEFLSGWETNEALINDKVDLAILPFTYIWLDAAKDRSIRIISCLERESDALICQPDIQSLQELNNKSIGVLKASTLDIFTEAVCEKYSLQAEIIYFRTPLDMASALSAGEVDAICFYVPSLFHLHPFFNILHWIARDFPRHPCCDLAASEKVIYSRKEDLKKIMAGLARSCEFIARNPDSVYALVQILFSLEPDIARKSVEKTVYHLALSTEDILFETKMAEIMQSRKYLDRTVAAEEVFYEIR
ncbi:MAG: ABC transporter substrate-binding protein [Candidatus Cloacimonetes bacterium]|nr:ABC transporter substrate-binding protein [Candidatus Cloacimonadota bacterium]